MKNGKISVKFRGKEVENPVARFIIGSLTSVAVLIAVTAGLLLIALVVVFTPIWLSMHCLLRVCGRKGFIKRTVEGKFKVHLTLEAFRKA